MQAWEDCGERRLQKVDMAAITTALERAAVVAWQAVVAGCTPRDIPDEQHVGVKLAAYKAWFMPINGFVKKEAFTAHLGVRHEITEVARFRMGSHSLDVEARRWGDRKIARSLRICPCCDMGKIEDELHFMLECPLYGVQREVLKRAKGITGVVAANAENMRMVVNGKTSADWKAIAQYINTCYMLRSERQKGLM
jgi:hypothetical protein